MKLNKTNVIIGAFIVFWIIIIAWGMLKTSLKLSKGKPSLPTAIVNIQRPKQQNAKETIVKPMPAPEETQPRRILVRALRTKTSDFQDVLPVMGSVKGKTEIPLKFEINGVVKKIYFHEGEKIKKGDAIAELDPKDTDLKFLHAKNKFNSAQAAYNSAKKKLEVNKSLYEAGAIIKSKLEEVELECESAKFQAEAAKSEMELAKNEQGKTCIYAAKDGVMGPREAEEGEFVTPQDKVGSLLEITEVYVEVGVVERDVEKIKIGQRAKVFVDSYPNVAFEGVVEYIFPVIEGKSRTLTVKINVPNQKELLLPGMFSRAEILIIELKNSIIIPITALISTKEGTVVVPVIPKESVKKNEDESQSGLLKLRKATLGYKTSDYAQVLKGVEAGDLIVLETQGEGKIEDNIEVNIIDIEETRL